jgi:hypothetical protein
MTTSKIQTLITAAGDSRTNFIAGGFNLPKSLIKWREREVILKSIDSYSINPEKLTVAINKAENEQFKITSVIEKNYPKAKIIPILSGVRGALATALLGLEELDFNSPLVIAAGDSFINGGILKYTKRFQDCEARIGTIVFKSENPRWSYLTLDDEGIVRNVQEKKVVSKYATTGVFYFKSVQDFVDAAKWVFVHNVNLNNIFYVSTSLNYMLSQGLKLEYIEILRENYKSLSLPSDFQEEKQNDGL